MDAKEKRKEKSALGTLGKSIKESIKRDGIGVGSFRLWINVGAAVIGFLLGGCHLAFGAYPFGVAFVSALPSAVWSALVGAALGSLTLGKGGMIYAMICVLSVFLRIIISGGADGKRGSAELFSEPVSLRVSAALISGFVAALYEILLGGIRLPAVIFGLSMIAFSSLFAFLFSGAFYHGIGVKSLIFGERRIFDRRESHEENQRILFFKASVSLLIAIISLSFGAYNIFGISLSFVFSVCITLFAAKRFGALYGGAVGFFSSAPVSGLFSPGFALVGILSGALFPYGARYATVTAGAALLVWGSYVSGVSGFLSLFPEYLIALCIIVPMLKHFERENKKEEGESADERVTDMVGTMALAYRSRGELVYEKMESALKNLIPVISSFLPSESTQEDFLGFLKLVGDSKGYVLEGRELDEKLTERLEGVLDDVGVRCGMIRAFGERRKYIICAGEDRDGTLITSPLLKEKIENASSMRFGTPKYYRRRDMALMECEAEPKYRINAYHLTERGIENEVCGDSVSFFNSDDLYCYGVISDGMGSGAVAKRTSDFAVRFLRTAASSGASKTTVVHMMNAIIRRQSEECSATLDVFSFDTLTGEAEFIKSGAAASYIKRKGSLYRIKSETMPLGLMKRVDAERIKVSVCAGDTVVMFSDGVCEPSEEAPWLIELLNEKCDASTEELTTRIAAAARLNNTKRDDVSVLVMRVESIE
ncbi:MAG: hypothetical protein E7673_00275 [Ruminococcaceae bacterium]|nr:hypothetical protein [Oscillospiraceae bacterium]